MFAYRFKHLRQLRKLNQAELGEILGVKKQTISNWENNNIMPSVAMLERIADYFHVTTDYLLGRDGPFDDDLNLLDITDLTPRQAECICAIVEEFRNKS